MHTIINGCVLFLWLQTLTFVKSQDCTLEQFLNGNLYDSNFDTTGLQASYPGGKQVRVSCSVGYSGFFKLICVEGQWQSRGSKCQPKSCGHPGDAEFADFHLDKGDDFVFGSQVVYTCHQGYQMVSRSNVRRCMADGWDGKIPVCEAQLCPVIHVSDKVQVFGDTEEATYGKVVRFSCKSSTEILDGPTEIFCNENSEWSEKPPTCKEITCNKPTIENGVVLGGIEVYREHEVLNYKCNPKYKRAEERPSKCTKLGSRAEWSPTPLCESARCELTLPPLEGTRYEPALRSAFSPGDRVRVICGENYWILNNQTNSTEILCQDDGRWNHRPVCQEIICSNDRDPLLDYWGVSYWSQNKVGDTAFYSCKSGYKSTNGGDEATCTRDGWTPKPLCQEIICSNDRDPLLHYWRVNSWYQAKVGDTAVFRCKSGYKSTNGGDRATCTRGGWTPKPLCQEITCLRKDYQNADIIANSKSVYKYYDQVRYKCKYNEDHYTLTCTDQGWRGSDRCPDKECQERPDIENAVIIYNDRRGDYRHGEHVEYRCSHGAQETFDVTCQQGEWTGMKSCSVCVKPDVKHGFVVQPNYTVPTAYYSCDDGYKLSTKGWWAETKCDEGVWSDLDTCIEQSRCGKGPMIPHGKATQRETRQGRVQTLQITCDDGYSASIPQINCREGQWNIDRLSLKTICTSDDDLCGPPPKVENAVVSTSYQKEYLSGYEVTYQCRHKYMTMGEDTIGCIRGKWEEKNIECIPFCGELKDEKKTMSFTAEKEKYMTGESIRYQCVVPEPTPEGIAICENGTWIKTVECKVKPCPGPSDIPDGQNTIIKGEDYVFGTVVKYSCNEGYQMVSGDSTQICKLSGWNGSVPVCERVTCQMGSLDPGLIAPSGNEIVRAGEMLLFDCRDDYDLEGDGEVECLGTGEWSGSFPTCSKKCQVPFVPSNVRFTPRLQRLSKGEKLTFSCKQQGHRIQGSKTIECSDNGLWIGQVPTCGAPSHCGRPPTLEDGDTVGTTREQYNQNDKVEYSCQSYYTMEGGPHKTCINGQWTGDIRCLKPCTVDREAMTRRNIRFRFSYQDKIYSTHNDEIEFMCTRGRPVGGVRMRQRCLHGVIELPTCE